MERLWMIFGCSLLAVLVLNADAFKKDVTDVEHMLHDLPAHIYKKLHYGQQQLNELRNALTLTNMQELDKYKKRELRKIEREVRHKLNKMMDKWRKALYDDVVRTYYIWMTLCLYVIGMIAGFITIKLYYYWV